MSTELCHSIACHLFFFKHWIKTISLQWNVVQRKNWHNSYASKSVWPEGKVSYSIWIICFTNLLCIDQFETSTCPLGQPPGVWTFEIAVGQIPGPCLGQDRWSNARPGGKILVQMSRPLDKNKMGFFLIFSFNLTAGIFSLIRHCIK